jgi:NADH:ubiquinone oxidoreductase subunit 2 (subunit N)
VSIVTLTVVRCSHAAKILTMGFAGAEGSAVWQGYVSGWTPVIAVVAALSMVLGNLTAIVQSSVKRLLAYSAIAHAGYILLGVLANTPSSRRLDQTRQPGSAGVSPACFTAKPFTIHSPPGRQRSQESNRQAAVL